jgi:hypothetical protein
VPRRLCGEDVCAAFHLPTGRATHCRLPVFCREEFCRRGEARGHEGEGEGPGWQNKAMGEKLNVSNETRARLRRAVFWQNEPRSKEPMISMPVGRAAGEE